jgi:hypothetical protein
MMRMIDVCSCGGEVEVCVVRGSLALRVGVPPEKPRGVRLSHSSAHVVIDHCTEVRGTEYSPPCYDTLRHQVLCT